MLPGGCGIIRKNTWPMRREEICWISDNMPAHDSMSTKDIGGRTDMTRHADGGCLPQRLGNCIQFFRTKASSSKQPFQLVFETENYTIRL
jgi:hypothetical protein